MASSRLDKAPARPKRTLNRPKYLDKYVTGTHTSHNSMGQRTHSTASLAYHRTSTRADVPISHSEDNIVRLTAAIQPQFRLPARFDVPDCTDNDHVEDQDRSQCDIVRLRPDSPNSDSSTGSRGSNAKLFDIVRCQEEAALERERIQAQVVAQQAEIALEKERIQAQATSQQTQA